MKRRFDLGEFLFGQGREAIEDVRAKLIDEAWFGRRSAAPRSPDVALGWVTEHDAEARAHAPDAPRTTFDEQWAPRPPGGDADPDHGIDR
ncbi:MAG: hypothetical protein EPN98_13995 [Phenylobacterium sp.]|uniref:hypothetical protein n=1 Tax=Phenylobacterium sp. TaxID=1871053 RepID=UPI001219C10D|nr:hypothetical protein [Phenylobacterium sp.]TAL32258.1 MAG: hypothetical protein EPN98_13995 [Phenylobacterium sp.]